MALSRKPMIKCSMKEKFPLRFFVVAFAWSWAIWLVLVLAGYQVIPIDKQLLAVITTPVSILAAFGPAVAAFVSLRTIQGRGAVGRYIKSFFDLRFGLLNWLVIFLVLGLSTIVAWLLPEFLGQSRLPMLLPNIYIFPIYWLIMVFLGGGQEEIGWRGYIMPHLESRFGIFFGSVLLALIWACWHIPLWFIPGTSQTYMNFFGFIMLTSGYSFFFSWVMKAAGGRPMAGLVAHGTANAFIPVFPVLIMQSGVQQTRFWIWVSLTLLIGVVFLFIQYKMKAGGRDGKNL